MPSEQLIALLGTLFGLIIAWLAFQQVRGWHQGDAINATSEAVVKLSERIKGLEEEKESIASRFESERDARQNLEWELAKVCAELNAEREARKRLESRLVEAQQRIDLLEIELDKRAQRIAELEAGPQK